MKYSYYSTKNNKLFYDIQEVKGFLISTGQIKPDIDDAYAAISAAYIEAGGTLDG